MWRNLGPTGSKGIVGFGMLGSNNAAPGFAKLEAPTASHNAERPGSYDAPKSVITCEWHAHLPDSDDSKGRVCAICSDLGRAHCQSNIRTGPVTYLLLA